MKDANEEERIEAIKRYIEGERQTDICKRVCKVVESDTGTDRYRSRRASPAPLVFYAGLSHYAHLLGIRRRQYIVLRSATGTKYSKRSRTFLYPAIAIHGLMNEVRANRDEIQNKTDQEIFIQLPQTEISTVMVLEIQDGRVIGILDTALVIHNDENMSVHKITSKKVIP